MKKLFLLAASMIALALTACCNKSEENTEAVEAEVVEVVEAPAADTVAAVADSTVAAEAEVVAE